MVGEDKKNADHFFNSRQKFCEVFFTKPLLKGVFAAFCHLPEPCRKRRDTPFVNAKRRQDFSCNIRLTEVVKVVEPISKVIQKEIKKSALMRLKR